VLGTEIRHGEMLMAARPKQRAAAARVRTARRAKR